MLPPPTSTKQLDPRTDAQRVAEEKRRKEKDIELLAFNSNEYVEGASVAENAEVQIFFPSQLHDFLSEGSSAEAGQGG